MLDGEEVLGKGLGFWGFRRGFLGFLGSSYLLIGIGVIVFLIVRIVSIGIYWLILVLFNNFKMEWEIGVDFFLINFRVIE